MTRASRTDRGRMPVGAVVGLAVAITAVLGLIAGAIWGLSSPRPSTSPSSSPVVTQEPSGSASPSGPSEPSASGTPSTSASATPSVTPVPPPSGSAPPAPATTTTSADGWRLGSWRITNEGGTLGVATTARNTLADTRSADLVLYVYVGGNLVATTTARVTDVPAGGSVPVQFTGTDPWQAGQKVLLLQVPRSG